MRPVDQEPLWRVQGYGRPFTGQVTMRKRWSLFGLIGIVAPAAAAGSCSDSGAGDPRGSAPARSSANASGPSDSALSLVVIGDSIPYNSPDDCPAAPGSSTGTPAHSNRPPARTSIPRTCPSTPVSPCCAHGRVARCSKSQLSSADAIIVGIAHNSFALNNDAAVRHDIQRGDVHFEPLVESDPPLRRILGRRVRP